MKVLLLLADSAQVCDGKLYMLGGGWKKIGPSPTPMAIALKIDVPWDETNRKHKWELKLFDEDGQAFTVLTPAGDRPLAIAGEFEAGRPAGHKQGTSVDFMMTFNLGPLSLSPGSFYVWKLFIDDETNDLWSYSFGVLEKKKQTPK